MHRRPCNCGLRSNLGSILADDRVALLPALSDGLIDGANVVGRIKTALRRTRTLWRLHKLSQVAIDCADPNWRPPVDHPGPLPVSVVLVVPPTRRD
jgi:hypothetical protein